MDPIIEVIQETRAMEIVEAIEGEILSEVRRVGVVVNRERLIKALEEAHTFYDEGYVNGMKDARRTQKRYTTHEVACIIAELFGDDCACNFNGNDEWLPEKCELLDVCPNTVGVACWEQYLKHRET